eukprot:CAMPEP_0184720234 /NCGR_PEP_ID=MMETSP0314-20130426/11419_1 /TAXON_ID=38298 /ORGANISM="Rhodella maculata, Strain CCMP 736" /LENGTH=37 /DNA_ID= /DNA_START= /DNA_END= /DNA_ORIENTATION=
MRVERVSGLRGKEGKGGVGEGTYEAGENAGGAGEAPP